MDAYHPDTILNDIFRKDEPLIIFDIGACEGESSVFYAKEFPEASLYAFEPVPKNFRLVCDKAEINPRIKPFPLALSNKNGKAVFHLSSGRPENASPDDKTDYGNKSSSLLAPEKHTVTHKWLKFESEIEVETKRPEDFCREQNIPHIDFIHIDVQGAELMVFEGMGDFLSKVKCIWTEVEELELYKNQPLRKDMEAFMDKHGFFKVYDTVNGISGDQFYARKDFYKERKGFTSYHKTKLSVKTASIRKKVLRNKSFLRIKYLFGAVLRKAGLR